MSNHAEKRKNARDRNRQRRQRTGIFSYVDEAKLAKLGITQYKAKTCEDVERNKILLLPPKDDETHPDWPGQSYSHLSSEDGGG